VSTQKFADSFDFREAVGGCKRSRFDFARIVVEPDILRHSGLDFGRLDFGTADRFGSIVAVVADCS